MPRSTPSLSIPVAGFAAQQKHGVHETRAGEIVAGHPRIKINACFGFNYDSILNNSHATCALKKSMYKNCPCSTLQSHS